MMIFQKTTRSFNQTSGFCSKIWNFSWLPKIANFPQNVYWKVLFHQNVFFAVTFRILLNELLQLFLPPKPLLQEKLKILKVFSAVFNQICPAEKMPESAERFFYLISSVKFQNCRNFIELLKWRACQLQSCSGFGNPSKYLILNRHDQNSRQSKFKMA